jgi:ribosomal protein S18 acetylase RimI-like enzyme
MATGTTNDAETGTQAALAWIHDAGNPYFDWLFGDPVTARAVLSGWLRRPESEVAASRVRDTRRVGIAVGGYIALTAAELREARRADAVALVADAPRTRRREQLTKLRQADGLFTEPSDEEFYLSKMGVLAPQRGKGHGRALLEAFCAEAAVREFPWVRLDVSADNHAAINLYHSAGFTVVEKDRRTRVGLTYFPMVRATAG